MTEAAIEAAVQKALASNTTKGVDKRLKYKIKNQDKISVSLARKLEFLWQAGMLKLTDENS